MYKIELTKVVTVAGRTLVGKPDCLADHKGKVLKFHCRADALLVARRWVSYQFDILLRKYKAKVIQCK